MVHDRVRTWAADREVQVRLGPALAGLGGGIRHSPVGSDREGPFRRAPPNPVVLGSEGWAEAFLKALRSAAPTGCVLRRQDVGSRTRERPARPRRLPAPPWTPQRGQPPRGGQWASR